MVVTCRGEFGVDHAGTHGSVVSAASGGHVSRAKPDYERFGVDFLFFIYIDYVEGKMQWPWAVVAHHNGSVRTPQTS
jgi:hypothetical protein